MIGRALLIVIAGLTLNSACLNLARAQVGGMPWMPPPGPGGPTVWPPAAPPAAPSARCVALKGILNDLQERGRAIGAANERKASVKVACQLFRQYLTAASKAVKTLETDGAACGAPPQVRQQVRANHVSAQKIRQQVCDAAARGPAAIGPTIRGWAPEDAPREFDDPSWHLHPTPAIEGPKPFRMSPERGP